MRVVKYNIFLSRYHEDIFIKPNLRAAEVASENLIFIALRPTGVKA